MGNQIYNTTEIKKRAGDIKTQNGDLRKVIAELDGIVSEMASVWKDTAQTQFVRKFNDLKPELDNFCKSIDSFADRAEQHAIVVENNEGVC